MIVWTKIQLREKENQGFEGIFEKTAIVLSSYEQGKDVTILIDCDGLSKVSGSVWVDSTAFEI